MNIHTSILIMFLCNGLVSSVQAQDNITYSLKTAKFIQCSFTSNTDSVTGITENYAEVDFIIKTFAIENSGKTIHFNDKGGIFEYKKTKGNGQMYYISNMNDFNLLLGKGKMSKSVSGKDRLYYDIVMGARVFFSGSCTPLLYLERSDRFNKLNY